jgi:MraZ protein
MLSHDYPQNSVIFVRDSFTVVSQFLGTHQNRLDAKGRVSVPASFRAALRGPDGSAALILRPSHKHRCIEAWPAPVFNALATPLQNLDLFSDAHDDMAAALYADAYSIEPDKEGRVMLPETLVAHAGLTESVSFMGLGRIFQIWEPAAAAQFRAAGAERLAKGGVLRSSMAAGG